MLTDNGNIVISKKPATAAEDYEGLRNTGINYIQQFSGKLWTDYNIHDPGVTIFELLCYALTDLAYRTSFPVADLLTEAGNNAPNASDFFTARKILTTYPITINDYRRLILDRIPGVRNVWLDTMDDIQYEPVIYFDKDLVNTSLEAPPSGHQYEALSLKGLYAVKIDAEDYQTIKMHHPKYLLTLAKFRDAGSSHTEVEAQPEEYKSCLKNHVTKILLNSRNLCEDFEIVTIASEELVAVCADIELQPDANADKVFLAINSALFNYINPALQFYSFPELIEKGKRTEDIFNAPAATRGFIDEEELKQHGHKEVLYVSDIINLLMDIPGILQVKKINISSYKKNDDGSYTQLVSTQQYCLHLQDKSNAVFKFMPDAAEQDKTKIFNHIRFSKGMIYFPPKRDIQYASYSFVEYPKLPEGFNNDIPIPSGKNRNLLNYYSVQNDFPLAYYTGMDGIPNGETVLRKAQRLQSKAYLLFFDQLLADYLAQLNNLKKVFTWRGGVSSPVMLPLTLNENMIKDLRLLLASEHAVDENIPDKDFFQSAYNNYNKLLETPAQQKARRNRLLDHLLARFNELFVDYSVFKFQQNMEGDFFDQVATEELINDKIHFLKLYPVISSKRSSAFNYTKDIYFTDNVSGLQLRVQKMLGIESSQNKSLVTALNNIDYKTLIEKMVSGTTPQPGDKLVVADNRFDSFDSNFGMHVLEHILLRPLYQQDPEPLLQLLPLCGNGSDNAGADCLLPDYYSMQMTVVVPGWLSISNNMDFRAFTESLIRTEAPAHVALKICWLDPALMFLFEKTTETFFQQMAKIKIQGAQPTAQDIIDFNTALNDVNAMMGLLKNMYLPSSLNECENINYNAEEDLMKVPVILNYSAIGSDGSTDWFVYNNMNGFANSTTTKKDAVIEVKKTEDKPKSVISKSKREKKQAGKSNNNLVTKTKPVSKEKTIINKTSVAKKDIKAVAKKATNKAGQSIKKSTIKSGTKNPVYKNGNNVKKTKSKKSANKKQAKKKNK
ncbi:MAG: hypothetical protein JST21_01075 [Bacteroidetes bacterium]|nr:hypothetical protein [Bacteroidota bacterium]